MTKTEIEFTAPNGFGSGRILLDDNFLPTGIALDLFSESDDRILTNVPAAQAHEIADWIKANVPVPVKIHPDWASIPVGARFGHYKDEAAALRGGKYPYLKVDENTVNYSGEIRTAPQPNGNRLVAEPEYAEARAAWDAMEVGDKFNFGDTSHNNIKEV